jgi:hypothetical protein
MLTVLGSAPRDSLEAGAIRESGARDVGEALDGRPGIQKLRKGGIANEPGWALQPGLALGSFGQVSPFVSGSFGGQRLAALGGFSFRRSDPYEGGSGRRFTN